MEFLPPETRPGQDPLRLDLERDSRIRRSVQHQHLWNSCSHDPDCSPFLSLRRNKVSEEGSKLRRKKNWFSTNLIGNCCCHFKSNSVLLMSANYYGVQVYLFTWYLMKDVISVTNLELRLIFLSKKQGDVANEVETEQIVVDSSISSFTKSNATSFVQVRLTFSQWQWIIIYLW